MFESVSLILELGVNQDIFSFSHFFQCVSVIQATQDPGFATTADEAGGTGNAGNDGQEKRDRRGDMKMESMEVNRSL